MSSVFEVPAQAPFDLGEYLRILRRRAWVIVVITVLAVAAAYVWASGQEKSYTAVGQIVSFRCDGCPAGLRARIVYVSPRAEYTPPVIYSVGSREKLVFMVEAVPIDPPVRLKPGQPVDVNKVFEKDGTARAEQQP